MFQKIIATHENSGTVIIRLMVGTVFLSEGIQKFLFSEKLAAGRFEKIGLLYPHFFGPFVGTVETACGLLLLIGLLTRIASIALIVIMLVALITTKASIYADDGLWEFLHASRTDWAMLVGSIFLLISGGGKWSVDNLISRDE